MQRSSSFDSFAYSGNNLRQIRKSETLNSAKPVVTPALAYLINHSLSDESARVDNSSAFNVGRPAAVMLGQTADALDAWTIGYSP